MRRVSVIDARASNVRITRHPPISLLNVGAYTHSHEHSHPFWRECSPSCVESCESRGKIQTLDSHGFRWRAWRGERARKWAENKESARAVLFFERGSINVRRAQQVEQKRRPRRVAKANKGAKRRIRSASPKSDWALIAYSSRALRQSITGAGAS